MATIQDVEALGYTVDVARKGVYVISGFGITNLYVPETDQATIDALADPALHAKRVEKFENPPQPPPPVSPLAPIIEALKKLDQDKPPLMREVVAVLEGLG